MLNVSVGGEKALCQKLWRNVKLGKKIPLVDSRSRWSGG